jgi:hypothetical protein
MTLLGKRNPGGGSKMSDKLYAFGNWLSSYEEPEMTREQEEEANDLNPTAAKEAPDESEQR